MFAEIKKNRLTDLLFLDVKKYNKYKIWRYKWRNII